MTDQEVAIELALMEQKINNMRTKLSIKRQQSANGRKQELSYVTKKLDLIVRSIHRIQDKMAIDRR